ncbi:MAG TPA: hypothetical protein ENK43_16520, partial [Planctomycetes bacterium]|nr:hypothetical protein [Planctomycetota bacterium]
MIGKVHRLSLRIGDRFSGRGLHHTCQDLERVARDTQTTVATIARPNYWIRTVSVLAILVLVAAVVSIGPAVASGAEGFTWLTWVEAAVEVSNLLIFLSVAIYFLWSLDVRLKRRRAIAALNGLREVAHVIDMHQLDKDPDSVLKTTAPTEHSPKRDLSPGELGRYLDYCSEMLSLVGKLGFLYVAGVSDPEVAREANDLESLCTGLSRKIWQKIMILRDA